MSIQALQWAFLQPIPTSERFVLVVLGDYADQDASCWPSRGSIMDRTGLSEASVKRALRSLQERGLISSEPRHRHDGSDTSNRYYLQIKEGGSPRPPRGSEGEGEGVTVTPRSEPPMNPQIDISADAFAEWWEIYPRRISKQAAIKAWKARLKDKTLPEISVLLDLTRRYAASVTGKEQEFIPHPSTWLNGHRWEDVSSAPQKPQDGGPSSAYLDWLETPEGKAHIARKESGL